MMRLLRFFFYHFYHAFAWTYDLVAAVVSVGRWQEWVLSALPYLRGPRVLELGHGPGHLQLAGRQRGLAMFGLDESRQMGRMAFSRMARNGLEPRLSRGYAQAMPFKTGELDEVVATFPTEYIFDPRTLAEARRVLRPGGKLVVVPVAWIGGKNLSDRAAAWLFHVTQQGSPLTEAAQERIRTHFTAAGFEAEAESVEKAHSTILVIVAKKPKNADGKGAAEAATTIMG